ncbi:MAG: LD-carboxypeptidase [Roseiflexaceae bacterium]|nr:LD-carboxypeptidase [Roseiflexaceae bacterium]
MPPQLYVAVPSYAMTDPADRADRLKLARTWADLCGWDVVESPLLRRYQAAGTWPPVALRAEDMRAALQHAVVWAAHGGYSAVELIPALLAADAPATPPLLIGYSDSTVLHACWQQRGWQRRIYGSLASSAQDSRRGESLLALLRGQGYRCDSTTEAAGLVLRPGTACAPLFAACLVVLAGLTGTPAMPSLHGTILAIEDTDERPYAVDFAMQQLYLSGALAGVAGLLCGSFHHTPHSDYGGPTVLEVLRGWADRLDVPCVARLPFGHMDDPMVLACGIETRLAAHQDGVWSVEWPPTKLV